MAATIPISCNHCGAPLQVSETARYVTCGHCNSRLQIIHQGGAWSTEVLQQQVEQLREGQRVIAAGLESLHVQREIEELDRSWQQLARKRGWQADVDTAGRSGGPQTLALQLVLVLVAILVFVVGYFALGKVQSGELDSGRAWLIVLLAAGLGGAAVVATKRSLGSYEKALETYRSRREELLAALDAKR